MFEPLPPSYPIYQRFFIHPARLALSYFTGVILLRSTFGSNYIETDLRKGAMAALPVLFETLNKFDGDEKSDKGMRLKRMLKDDLYEVMIARHLAFHEAKLTPNLSLNLKDDTLLLQRLWYSFGSKLRKSQTTLIPAKTTRRVNSATIVRKDMDGNEWYRTAGLEYSIESKDQNLGDAMQQGMLHVLIQGRVYAVDITFPNAEVEMSFDLDTLQDIRYISIIQ